MPYKYELSALKKEAEADKANDDNIVRHEWPRNYVDAIVSEAQCGKHLLIPSDTYVLAMLRVKNMPYAICHPERRAKDEYHRRYLSRGNTENFTDIFIGRWDAFMNALENDGYGLHIVLKPGEYLSDVFQKCIAEA
jgi:hypothetical protein